VLSGQAPTDQNNRLCSGHIAGSFGIPIETAPHYILWIEKPQLLRRWTNYQAFLLKNEFRMTALAGYKACLVITEEFQQGFL
jgi:hypothetical protein